MNYIVVYFDNNKQQFREFKSLLGLVEFFQENPKYIVLRVARVQE